MAMSSAAAASGNGWTGDVPSGALELWRPDQSRPFREQPGYPRAAKDLAKHCTYLCLWLPFGGGHGLVLRVVRGAAAWSRAVWTVHDADDRTWNRSQPRETVFAVSTDGSVRRKAGLLLVKGSEKTVEDAKAAAERFVRSRLSAHDRARVLRAFAEETRGDAPRAWVRGRGLDVGEDGRVRRGVRLAHDFAPTADEAKAAAVRFALSRLPSGHEKARVSAEARRRRGQPGIFIAIRMFCRSRLASLKTLVRGNGVSTWL